MIKNLKTKKPILFSVIIATLTITGLLLIGYLLSLTIGKFYTDTTDYYIFYFISESVAVVYVLLFAYICGNLYTLKRKGIGFVRSIFVGAYPITLIIILTFIMFFTELLLGNEILSGFHIAAYLGSMFLIGVVEETVFRGIIAESIMLKYGKSRKGIWIATLVSGIIFGFAHISNMLGSEPLGVFVQISVAGVLGMLFAAIYYRTGNLWICILIHGGLDAASLISSGIFGQGTAEDFISSFSLINLVPCITYFIPVLILLRKSKIEVIIHNFHNSYDAKDKEE